MARPIQFALFQPQMSLTFPMIKERAQAAEELGFHSIWFPDHMWGRGMPQVDYLESWTLMTAVATVTTKLRVGGLALAIRTVTPRSWPRWRRRLITSATGEWRSA